MHFQELDIYIEDYQVNKTDQNSLYNFLQYFLTVFFSTLSSLIYCLSSFLSSLSLSLMYKNIYIFSMSYKERETSRA